MLTKKPLFIGVLFLMSLNLFSQVQSNINFELDTKKLGASIQSTMYGVFFEDINFGADGGLYAELVKNRSFDFPQNLMGWNTFGNVEVMKEEPLFPNNPTYLKISNINNKHIRSGIENEGFRGIGLKKGANYRFSVWARKETLSENQKLQIQLIDSKNETIGYTDLEITDNNWKLYEINLSPKRTEEKGHLRIFLETKGIVFLEHVSLFPLDTWKDRKNGLRKDLAQALDDLNPGVFRFPGGCIVEGGTLDTRYNWKKSIGPVENRPLNENRWNYSSKRLYPDYYQTYGLGFFEFFLLAEDMGAEPLPIVNVGLACQYQNKECCEAHAPVGELDEFVQDALDLIEFANGDVNSTWGKVRAEMGHPEPFNMKFIGLGNEQWGTEYIERLAVFMKAIQEKHSEIKLIGSSGPSPDGDKFDYLWPEMKRLKVDLVDEHYYRSPEWFFENAARYDNYNRKAPAVFAGEYASHDRPKRNNYLAALSEAAFMTGLERNADIVHMCTYAPLFAHIDAWQWQPDLIWFNNLNILKTPSYYVQQLYAKNSGTNVINLTWNKKPITGQENLYASAVYNSNDKCYILKVINANDSIKEIQVELKGIKNNQSIILGNCFVIKEDNPKAENTFDNPQLIIPQETTAQLDGNILKLKAEKQSFGVYRIIMQ